MYIIKVIAAFFVMSLSTGCYRDFPQQAPTPQMPVNGSASIESINIEYRPENGQMSRGSVTASAIYKYKDTINVVGYVAGREAFSFKYKMVPGMDTMKMTMYALTNDSLRLSAEVLYADMRLVPSVWSFSLATPVVTLKNARSEVFFDVRNDSLFYGKLRGYFDNGGKEVWITATMYGKVRNR